MSDNHHIGNGNLDHTNDFNFEVQNWNSNPPKDYMFLNNNNNNNNNNSNSNNSNSSNTPGNTSGNNNNNNSSNSANGNNNNTNTNTNANANNSATFFNAPMTNPLLSPMNLSSAPSSPADFMVQQQQQQQQQAQQQQQQSHYTNFIMEQQLRFNNSPHLIPKDIQQQPSQSTKNLKQQQRPQQQQQQQQQQQPDMMNQQPQQQQPFPMGRYNIPPGFPHNNQQLLNQQLLIQQGQIPPQAIVTQQGIITPMLPVNNQINSNRSSNNSNNSNNFKKELSDLPPQPRTKVKPCDHCRRKKSKCVMIPETNTCKQCELKGLKCTVTDPSVLKRGLNSNNVNEMNKKSRFDDSNIPPPPNIPIREVQPIKDYSSMQGHSLLKKTLSLQYPRSSFYIGPTSIYDPVLLDKIKLDKIDQFQLNNTTSIRKVASDVQFTLRDDFTEDLYQRSERDVDIVERYAAPHGQALINLYFRTVHPSFPVLHKRVFLEKYSRTHREFGAPLLAAVYCLAIQWWDYDPILSQYAKPNVDALQKFALKTFCDVIQRPKLSAVQAGLLLLQCRTSQDRNWLLCSQVVALAEELGLGLDCATWKLPKWERGLRRRLAWAVYVQDKWSALIESRPSHICEGKNWLVRKVTDEDFPEKNNESDNNKEGSSDIENGKQLFKEMISLSEIVSEILDNFFTMSSIENLKTIDQILKVAKPLQLKLRDWYHSLPKNLQMNSLQPRKLNSNGYLQLAYFAAELTLHRRIISSLNYDSPPELVKVCRNAAKTRLTAAIEFARDLKPEHIHSFWHSSATTNFTLIGTFAAILFVTSQNPEEESGYKDQLFDYRWILKINSKGFDQALDALEKLDNILSQIPGLLETSIVEEPDSVAQNDLINNRSSSSTPLPQTNNNSPRPSSVETPPSNNNTKEIKDTNIKDSNISNIPSPSQQQQQSSITTTTNKLSQGSLFQKNASTLREEIANSNTPAANNELNNESNNRDTTKANNSPTVSYKSLNTDEFPPMSMTPEIHPVNPSISSSSGGGGGLFKNNNSKNNSISSNKLEDDVTNMDL